MGVGLGHVPVLAAEVSHAFASAPIPLRRLVDCTLGAAGHSRALVRRRSACVLHKMSLAGLPLGSVLRPLQRLRARHAALQIRQRNSLEVFVLTASGSLARSLAGWLAGWLALSVSRARRPAHTLPSPPCWLSTSTRLRCAVRAPPSPPTFRSYALRSCAQTTRISHVSRPRSPAAAAAASSTQSTTAS